PARRVGHDAHRRSERQLHARARRLAQKLDRRLAAQIFERDVAGRADLPSLERLDEVGMAQTLAEPSLVNEELYALRLRGVVGQDSLDDDQALVACILGQKDLRHATEGESTNYAVTAELVRYRVRLHASSGDDYLIGTQ